MANEIMFYGGIAGAVLFGIGTVILFITFRIHTVIGELTGITAKRSIRRIQREGYGEKSKVRAIRENTSEIVTKRGRTTKRLQKKEENQTVVLNQENEGQTTVLDQELETVVLNQEPEEATTVLHHPKFRFEIEEDIVVTYSEEKI